MRAVGFGIKHAIFLGKIDEDYSLTYMDDLISISFSVLCYDYEASSSFLYRCIFVNSV